MTSEAAERGLYVHIPFCLKKCHYCNYTIAADAPADLREKYFTAIEAEIQNAATKHGRLTFDTLYLGGGTPSSLTAAEMEKLVSLIRKNFDFKENAETTCEVNPGEVDADKLRAYKELGVNRISLGAQSFNDSLLSRMGRIHNSNAIFETARLLKDTGFTNVSFDLIIRLPGQTENDVADAVQKCVALGAGQVVVYDLNVHDDTVFGVLKKKGGLNLPGEAHHERMAALVEKKLVSSGFVQYEISSFAKPGFESRHNLIYWHNQDYLGLGPGAYSYMDGVRYEYARDVSSYLKKALEGDWTNAEEDRLSPEKIELETLLTGLRLKEGVSMAPFNILRKDLERQIPLLIDAGLLSWQADRVALTSRGKRIPETVFVTLIPDQRC